MQLLKPNKREDKSGGTLMRVRDEMNRMLDRFVHEPWNFPWMGRNGSDWFPAMDIMDDEREVIVRSEVPGVPAKNVDVSISGNILTISGEKEESQSEEGKEFFLSERTFGCFRRSITLPDGIDPDRVTAQQENGVLTVRIGKVKGATPKHVPVKAAANG